ncbi:MAG TPA: protocatechuate 3,4-dioxygenase subunit alpha [Actinomycetaceae bacterium]|nr:protocatechuate 3,4-dioxygenase subunit alpha [Actinomycetaceae bacterium]
MTATEPLYPTPGQTIGPFFGFALPYERGDQLLAHGHPEAVELWGIVRDGHGQPIPDAMVEIWQADGDGEVTRHGGALQRDGHTFTGFGRVGTDNNGRYSFTTRVPGRSAEGRPRFIAMTIFARGLTNRLFTRIYLPEDEDLFERDDVLAGLPAARRDTLIAKRVDGGYQFDVNMQGEEETVFLRYTRHPAQ